MSSPQEVVSGLPVMRGNPIPVNVLEASLVESGGKAFLLQNRNIPDDEHYVILSMDINNEGSSFGGFNIFWNGPEVSVTFSEKYIFEDGDASVKLSWNVRPRDVKFLGNSWLTKWMDGAEGVLRKEINVENGDGEDPQPIVDAYKDPGRKWSYRYLVIVKNVSQPVLVIQVLPLDTADISASPWANSAHVSGICVVSQEASWFPTLPPEHNHNGPAPFLVDHRSPEAKAEKKFITSQLFRDTVVYALTRALAPIQLSAQSARTYAPTGMEVPKVGAFFRVMEQNVRFREESDDTPHQGGIKRPCMGQGVKSPVEQTNASDAGSAVPLSQQQLQDAVRNHASLMSQQRSGSVPVFTPTGAGNGGSGVDNVSQKTIHPTPPANSSTSLVLVDNGDGTQSYMQMQLYPLGQSDTPATIPPASIHDPTDPTLLEMGIATQDLLDKMPPGVSQECLEKLPLSRAHDLLNLGRCIDPKKRSASLIQQAITVRLIPAEKDDRMSILHSARFFSKSLAPPVDYWREVPVKIEPILPSIQLEHMGLEFAVSTRTLALCHNRAAHIEIRYFLRVNRNVLSLPVHTKHVHSEVTGQAIGTSSDLAWKKATKMKQIMDGLLAYQAVYDSLHPYDYGPMNIIRAMFNWHFLAFRSDQLQVVRDIINSIMARNAELADQLRPPMTMSQLDDYIKASLIGIGGKYQIPESFAFTDLFTVPSADGGRGGGVGREGGAGQGNRQGAGGRGGGAGSGYGRDRGIIPSPTKFGGRKGFASVFHGSKEVCGMFNTRGGCPRAKAPSAKECTLTTKDGKSRQLAHVCSYINSGVTCGNPTHNYFNH